MYYTHEDIKQAISQVLRSVRKNNGYKIQEEFAGYLNNSRATISGIESPSNNVKFSTLEKYSYALGISQKEIMILIEENLKINNKQCPSEIHGNIYEKLSQLIKLSDKKYFIIASNTELLEDTIKSIKIQRRVPSVTTFILIVNELGYQPSSLFDE